MTIFHRSFFLLLLFVFSIARAQNDSIIDGHPAWIIQGNIYEVNVRQYTPEGTFKAFEKNLDHLKDMGVQTLWFMPINPISKVDRKGALGSYYAVADFKAINPEFGNMNDWKALVKSAHSKGFKVLMDWVPNHSGADNSWLKTHPDFYVKDSLGNPKMEFDWTDTRKLNYDNPELVDTMINCMKFWITETGIDGFRCDHADGPTQAFWTRCIKELKAVKNVFMLAEAEQPWMFTAGFDAIYPWPMFHTMVDVAGGKKNATALDSVLHLQDSLYPRNGLMMYFTSNHDENSWNKADYATMPGESHAPFAVLTQTLPRSVPEIYSGQEEPFLDSISFFYKDTIVFSNYARAPFYKTLLLLRKSNPALAADASFTKMQTGNDENIFAFKRQKGNNKVMVIVNLSNTAQSFRFNGAMPPLMRDMFTQKLDEIHKGEGMTLPAWGYRVYSY
ncbi:alpha-amylase [Ilyomonas limi]|uniref:Alpha-amylase n=1 Tax=Ilyomonas limi TaxID=2575867 RepID=A0A4V5UVL6_9BACT|nr:alpha-amylase family glycosyl hydrolase [Ilyomonas limi]TKK65323.1 alpha-amylase [Ilyomonas limi]